MEKAKAIELLRNAVPAKALPDDEIGFFIEAVSMAIKSLEQAHFVSGNTLVVTLPEEDLKATNRVLLDCKPWAKIFYADGGKDTNVPSKWIPVSERLPKCEQEVLICTKVKLVGKDAYIDSIITPAFYEDGTMTENDSAWRWEEVDWAGWDEEGDCGIIPEGWWENRHFNPDDLLNCPVDREVVAWMPLPQPYKEG